MNTIKEMLNELVVIFSSEPFSQLTKNRSVRQLSLHLTESCAVMLIYASDHVNILHSEPVYFQPPLLSDVTQTSAMFMSTKAGQEVYTVSLIHL